MPSKIRKKLNINAGEKISFFVENGVITIKRKELVEEREENIPFRSIRGLVNCPFLTEGVFLWVMDKNSRI